MITISLDGRDGFTEDDFLELVEKNDDDKYEITAEKETVQFFSTNEDIAMEYYSAAFVGEKLNEIASEFDYDFPAPQETGDFTFTITTNDKNKLAEILTYLSAGYGNLEDDGANMDFHSEAQDLVESASENSAACFDLIEICRQFINEPSEEGEGDD